MRPFIRFSASAIAGFAIACASATSAQTSAPATVSSSSDINLLSFDAGAWIVKAPAEYNEEWSAFWLLDERPATGWATPKGIVTTQQLVLALPEQTMLTLVEFGTASVDGDDGGSRGAKDITLEISDTSATSGFQSVGAFTLKPRLDRQRFPIAKPVAGRWVRITIKNNYGSGDYIELMDVRGYGQQLTHSPVADFSGEYTTNFDKLRLAQSGASVEGCYEHANGLLESGGVDGRVIRFTWVQDGADGKKDRGPAVIAFSPDGKSLLGLWWYEGETGDVGKIWKGDKVSARTGACAHWKGRESASAQLAKDLADTGRVRIYGIHFDTDSDQLKDESKPALDNIVRMAKEHPNWKFGIEGHTDSTATAAHNQTLSERRAVAVKTYLSSAGISADRLAPVGMGSSKPVSDNGTALGRAQNRRVELVKAS